MTSPLHHHARRVYKQLIRLSPHHPDPNYQLDQKTRECFRSTVNRLASITDPKTKEDELAKAIAKARYLKKEIEALIFLARYRELKRRYGDNRYLQSWNRASFVLDTHLAVVWFLSIRQSYLLIHRFCFSRTMIDIQRVRIFINHSSYHSSRSSFKVRTGACLAETPSKTYLHSIHNKQTTPTLILGEAPFDLLNFA